MNEDGTTPTSTTPINRAMIAAYDEYTHLTLDRRGFMEKLTKLAGSSAAAAAIAPMLAANSAKAAIVAADDERLTTRTVTFETAAGQASGYLAMPADKAGPLPGIVVVHENRGQNEHIRDVARRAALAGFVALAPDFLSTSGGTPSDEDQARSMISGLTGTTVLDIGLGAVRYLAGSSETNGKVGAVGFCWGGAMVNELAVNAPDLAAAVAYYGRVPDAADVPRIKVRLLLHYAGLDDRINAGIPDFRAALDAAGVDYAMYTYEGVNHAFNNDTSAARYDEAAAALAWQRTIDFFKETLG
ncbi:dienelactone hydrolase family protein [Microbaculum sp. FT89]|uniref:dienelactone hydrolase family protein n=1 Tax=Microbaculum sp. FT89 TaxID=3447298 RepID=UPI003F53035E